MNTDRLIDMLSANVEPVRPSRLTLPVVIAVVIGAVAAFCLMLALLGLRSDIATPPARAALVPKLLFALSLVGIGSVALMRCMRPGQGIQKLALAIALPFLIVGFMGVAALVVGERDEWGSMVLGAHWATRLVCIPLFATLPFVILIWAVRRGAPTELRRAGAIMGMVAGALAAAAYAFFCPDDSLPSIAIWYAAAIAICAGIGALLGPRLLRW